MTGEDCHDHARRITIVETKVDMIFPAIEKINEKLDGVAATLTTISNNASEQKGKAEAKFGFSDMLIMVALGAMGSYLVGTFVM